LYIITIELHTSSDNDVMHSFGIFFFSTHTFDAGRSSVGTAKKICASFTRLFDHFCALILRIAQDERTLLIMHSALTLLALMFFNFPWKLRVYLLPLILYQNVEIFIKYTTISIAQNYFESYLKLIIISIIIILVHFISCNLMNWFNH